MASWVPIEEASDFSLQNLPYGTFSSQKLDRRIGVAVGRYVLDMKVLSQNDVFTSFDKDVAATLQDSTLNRYAALGRKTHRGVRALLQDLLSSETTLGHVLRDNDALRAAALVPLGDVQMHLPMEVGDYTDFFVVPYHAKNVSEISYPCSPKCSN